jgi:hypothetical protein
MGKIILDPLGPAKKCTIQSNKLHVELVQSHALIGATHLLIKSSKPGCHQYCSCLKTLYALRGFNFTDSVVSWANRSVEKLM